MIKNQTAKEEWNKTHKERKEGGRKEGKTTRIKPQELERV